MIKLFNILESVLKKIKFSSPEERLNYKIMSRTLTDYDIDKYVEEIHKNGTKLDVFMGKYHIPREFKTSFNKEDSDVRIIPNKHWEHFSKIFLPHKSTQGFEQITTKFSVSFERYITEKFIVYWIGTKIQLPGTTQSGIWMIKPRLKSF